MKLTQFLSSTLLLLGWLSIAPIAQAQHGHLNVGASGQNQNDPLVWANGAGFAASSGYIKELIPADPAGPYKGYYDGAITLTSLASTPGGPALGAFVQGQIVSVEGPAGGHFGFWEDVEDTGSTTPTFSIPSGTKNGLFAFDLSDASAGAGKPGADAFGHLHGRRFTADTLGDYLVGFRAVDTSANGTSGGPIHTASDILYIHFAAVPEPTTLAVGVAGLGALALLRGGVARRKE